MKHTIKNLITIATCITMSLPYLAASDTFEPFPKRPEKTVTKLEIANVFNDGAILQRNQKVRIWGWAKPEAEVIVKFAEQSIKSKADSKGAWQLLLNPMKASFEERTLKVTSANDTLTINNILVGEVWLCGGQSNMERKLFSSLNADLELLSGDFPAIRFLRIPKKANTYPQADFTPAQNGQEGHWKKCQGTDLSQCSAVGYYFAKRLHRILKVPVGLIDTSWGGTMAQHWAEHGMLKKIEDMKPYFAAAESAQKSWIDNGKEKGAIRDHKKAIAQWQEKIKSLKPGQRRPGKPKIKTDPVNAHQPAGMVNGLIAPISGYSINGILYYQGENNSFADTWKPYKETLKSVIKTFRKSFGNPNIPFGIIQIAGWSTRRTMVYDMNHHCNIVREIQFDTWRNTPNTGLIVSFDTNSDSNIHPKHKRPLGERSARWALADVYKIKDYRNQPIKWRGPVYKNMEIKGNKCIVSFEKLGSQGLKLNKSVDVGFYIAGEDKVFHHAKASASRGKVTIWSDAVQKPVAVRYASSNLPIGGLINGNEIPAYPFRSDNWPIKPHRSKLEYLRHTN